VKANKRATL